MNSKIIRELVNQFNNVHETSDYAEYMMYNEKLSEHERHEYELEADMSMYELYDIAEKIKKLNPSKYMIEKYNLDYSN